VSSGDGFWLKAPVRDPHPSASISPSVGNSGLDDMLAVTLLGSEFLGFYDHSQHSMKSPAWPWRGFSRPLTKFTLPLAD
jgi:hypothetical protein